MATPVNNLLAQLKAALAKEEETPTEGFKTAQEWSEEWNLSLSRASHLIRAGLQNGIMVKKQFRIDTPRGLYPVPHYAQKR